MADRSPSTLPFHSTFHPPTDADFPEIRPLVKPIGDGRKAVGAAIANNPDSPSTSDEQFSTRPESTLTTSGNYEMTQSEIPNPALPVNNEQAGFGAVSAESSAFENIGPLYSAVAGIGLNPIPIPPPLLHQEEINEIMKFNSGNFQIGNNETMNEAGGAQGAIGILDHGQMQQNLPSPWDDIPEVKIRWSTGEDGQPAARLNVEETGIWEAPPFPMGLCYSAEPRGHQFVAPRQFPIPQRQPRLLTGQVENRSFPSPHPYVITQSEAAAWAQCQRLPQPLHFMVPNPHFQDGGEERESTSPPWSPDSNHPIQNPQQPFIPLYPRVIHGYPVPLPGMNPYPQNIRHPIQQGRFFFRPLGPMQRFIIRPGPQFRYGIPAHALNTHIRINREMDGGRLRFGGNHYSLNSQHMVGGEVLLSQNPQQELGGNFQQVAEASASPAPQSQKREIALPPIKEPSGIPWYSLLTGEDDEFWDPHTMEEVVHLLRTTKIPKPGDTGCTRMNETCQYCGASNGQPHNKSFCPIHPPNMERLAIKFALYFPGGVDLGDVFPVDF